MDQQEQVLQLIDMLHNMVSEAWGVPLGNDKCIIERNTVLNILEQIKEQLPVELAEARRLMLSRDDYINKAREEADSMRRSAQEDAQQMVEREQIVQRARLLASETVSQAEKRTGELYQMANEYVDEALRRAEESMSNGYQMLHDVRTRFQSAARTAAQQVMQAQQAQTFTDDPAPATPEPQQVPPGVSDYQDYQYYQQGQAVPSAESAPSDASPDDAEFSDFYDFQGVSAGDAVPANNINNNNLNNNLNNNPNNINNNINNNYIDYSADMVYASAGGPSPPASPPQQPSPQPQVRAGFVPQDDLSGFGPGVQSSPPAGQPAAFGRPTGAAQVETDEEDDGTQTYVPGRRARRNFNPASTDPEPSSRDSDEMPLMGGRRRRRLGQ